MKSSAPDTLKPRKKPKQGRAAVTVDDILEATIQVLLLTGSSGVSTTRVADRAGVSIGTLYQYFPNRQALLLEALRSHLDRMATKLEATCELLHGQPLRVMITTVIDTFIKAKTANIDESRALYFIASELKAVPVVSISCTRLHTALFAMLEAAPDFYFEQLSIVTFMFYSILAAPTRSVLEGHAPPEMIDHLREQLNIAGTAYLMAMAQPR